VILGLTGPNAAGKGEVASHLERCGFKLHSLADIVREEAARQGFPPEREHLIRVGNELRRDLGAGALATRILSRLGQRDAVDSIRNPAEVAVLREREEFVLLGITAQPETRFRRSLERGRPGDPETFEVFQARERQENSSDPGAQQLGATFELADHVLCNNGDLDGLGSAVDELLASLQTVTR
jgi:dephospho-CoA kinase